jgi:hypothetical protein
MTMTMTITRDLDPLLLDHREPPIGARLDDGTPDLRSPLDGMLTDLPRGALPRLLLTRSWRLFFARRSGGWS